MDKEHAQQDLIDRYLRLELSEAERQAFEQRMQEEAELAVAVDEQRALYALIKKRGQLQVKDRLQAIEAQLAPAQKSRSKIFIWLALLLAAAALLLSLWWWSRPSAPRSPELLYAAYFEAYRPPANLRGAGNSILLRAQASELYQNGAYKESIPYWERLLSVEGGGTLQDRFYLGMSLLAADTSTAARAIPYFREVAAQDNDFQQPARWYLALAHLRAGEMNKARALLQSIQQEQGYRWEQAQRLLQELK